MLVCWEWLSQYVKLTADPDRLANMFAMSGLNHESTKLVGKDTVIDLEVTSNRGDCLGHIGVAREAAVLLGQSLCVPNPLPNIKSGVPNKSIKVENQFADACTRYTARVIRGVKIGPSPEWLVRRLAAIGVNSVNNVVDVTNYVMMECGQPLHAFDLKQVRGGKIIVRPANKGEKFLAIDHRTYELDEKMVVIADTERAVALGGVMGGADSEITDATTDLLIESAAFEPLSIRRTARKLKLQSPSSFRFERRPDPAAVEWASRRCCELVLQVAGGTLEEGVSESAPEPSTSNKITFRLAQIERVLGISVPRAEVERILVALGCELKNAGSTSDSLEVVSPSWRGDLQREIDLIEEVARIYGYDKIPENVPVPLSVAPTRDKDIVLQRVRLVLSAFGVDEAITPSVVTDELDRCGSVWSAAESLAVEIPLLEGARKLRRSLLPSLLAAKYTNQSFSIRNAQLYEVANVYTASGVGLPHQQSTLGIVVNNDLTLVKGVVEAIVQEVAGNSRCQWSVTDHPVFASGAALRIQREEEVLGWIGVVNSKVQNQLSLDQPVAAAELNVDVLTKMLKEVRRAEAISQFPAVSRDLNFVVAEELRWEDLSAACRQSGGEFLQDVCYQETYRDPKKDGVGKKRVLLTLQFQSLKRTLTSEEVDQAVSAIIASCQKQFAASLLT